MLFVTLSRQPRQWPPRRTRRPDTSSRESRRSITSGTRICLASWTATISAIIRSTTAYQRTSTSNATVFTTDSTRACRTNARWELRPFCNYSPWRDINRLGIFLAMKIGGLSLSLNKRQRLEEYTFARRWLEALEEKNKRSFIFDTLHSRWLSRAIMQSLLFLVSKGLRRTRRKINEKTTCKKLRN